MEKHFCYRYNQISDCSQDPSTTLRKTDICFFVTFYEIVNYKRLENVKKA